ncbi:MAG: tRNA (guanosine(46)-N7)-methyltransferase TrmB, partial [Pseudomonadales bacterium]|nr:tRNA (guanosine(46)-N7)-methyltransferase TrmB [Pseudomonadales bacterium]
MEKLSEPMDLKAVFGNENPLEFEIGIGKGLFLLNAARENPDHNFLGIEVARKYLNKARERISKRDVPNARVIHGEAYDFLERFLTEASLTTVHIYFPDPWPKKRHHKRRLFSQDFIKLVHSRLIKGGQLLVATDHAGYWEWISE